MHAVCIIYKAFFQYIIYYKHKVLSHRATGFAPRLLLEVNIWIRTSISNNMITRAGPDSLASDFAGTRVSPHSLTYEIGSSLPKMPTNSDLSCTISSVTKNREAGVTTATRAKKRPTNSGKICSSSSQIEDFLTLILERSHYCKLLV